MWGKSQGTVPQLGYWCLYSEGEEGKETPGGEGVGEKICMPKRYYSAVWGWRGPWVRLLRRAVAPKGSYNHRTLIYQWPADAN